MFPIGNLIADSTAESRRSGGGGSVGGGEAARWRRWQQIRCRSDLADGHLSATGQSGRRQRQSRTISRSGTDTRMIVSTSNVLQNRFPVMIPVLFCLFFFG